MTYPKWKSGAAMAVLLFCSLHRAPAAADNSTATTGKSHKSARHSSHRAKNNSLEFVGRLNVGKTAPVPKAGSAQTKWEVLVLDYGHRDYERSKMDNSADHSEEYKAQAGNSQDSDDYDSFRTICFDQSQTRSVPGAILKLNNRLLRLSTPKKKFCDGCLASILLGKPIGGGSRLTFNNQIYRDAKAFAAENIVGLKEKINERGGTNIGSFTSSLDIESIYQDLVGLSIYEEPFVSDATHPDHEWDFGTFRTSKSGLSRLPKSFLPRGITTVADRLLQNQSAEDKENCGPFDFKDFVVIPYRQGAAVEFHFPSTVPVSPTQLFARVPITTNLLPDSRADRAKMQKDHPAFLKWSNLDLCSISPDSSSAVYVQDGKLFWKDLSGKVVPLSKVTLVRGVQWFPVEPVNAADQQTLFKADQHSAEVNSVDFSPDGRTLVSGSDDTTIKIWDTASGKILRTLTGHSNGVKSVHFSPDGKMLASGSADKTVKLWDVASGKTLRTLAKQPWDVCAVAFSPNGKMLASTSGELGVQVKLWDVASGKTLRTLARQSLEVKSLAFSPDGKTLASDSFGTIKLWNVASGKELRTLALTSEGHSNAVVFSPNGKKLAISFQSPASSIALGGVASGKQLRVLDDLFGVGTVAFSPDGKTIASGNAEGNIILWNAASGKQLRTLDGHSDAVNSVAFSPDGKTLASGSADGTVKWWDLVSGKELHTFSRPLSRLNSQNGRASETTLPEV